MDVLTMEDILLLSLSLDLVKFFFFSTFCGGVCLEREMCKNMQQILPAKLAKFAFKSPL